MAKDVDTRADASQIESILSALRSRTRRYILADGTAQMLAAAAVIFWTSVVVDWIFEPPRVVRALLLAVALVTILLLLGRLVIAKALVRITPQNLALVLERQFPQLEDRLLTAVDTAAAATADQDYHRQLLAVTRQAAIERLRGLDLDSAFKPMPLVRSVLVAAVLLGSIALFALASPRTFQTWANRALGLADVLYPRKTRLSVAGFERGSVKVARGADFQVVAQADTRMEVPRTVQIVYTTAGLRDRAVMDREGNARPEQERFQKYSYTFHVLSPIQFDLMGGDDRIDDLRIEAVDVPTVDVGQSYLACTFPGYLGREPRSMPITATVSLPRGTEVTLRALATKDLVKVDVARVAGADSPLNTIQADPKRPRRFELPLGKLAGEQAFLFTLHDTDGVHSREPWRLVLSAIPDNPPQMTIRLRGIGSAITPQARIPLSGPLADDYGLSRAWYECMVGEGQPVVRDLTVPVAQKTQAAVDEALEIREFGVKPGQVLQLQLKVQDNCGLETGPNQSVSERFSLQVVTPEELRAMLESRELNLRRRFEELISEVTATRESLSQIAGGTTGPASDRSAAAAEGESPGGNSAKMLLAEQAVQNSRKNADETLGVAVAFDDIHDELVNNRVDTEELKSRLKQGIAEPLHQISADRFAELDRRLVALAAALAKNSPAVAAALDASNEQLDLILVEMQQVLDKMMEMETFNEVVDMLRSIIDAQLKLNDQTKAQRRQSVRRLLEE
jgi:hypothetical protein